MKIYGVAIGLITCTLFLQAAEEGRYPLPEGMSPANAFAALYEKAEVLGMGVLAPQSGKSFDTLEEATSVFAHQCEKYNGGYCDYVRGKRMKVDFSEKDCVHIHTREAFAGYDIAALLQAYHQRQPHEKIDPFNTCTDLNKAARLLQQHEYQQESDKNTEAIVQLLSQKECRKSLCKIYLWIEMRQVEAICTIRGMRANGWYAPDKALEILRNLKKDHQHEIIMQICCGDQENCCGIKGKVVLEKACELVEQVLRKEKGDELSR